MIKCSEKNARSCHKNSTATAVQTNKQTNKLNEKNKHQLLSKWQKIN